MEEEEKKKKIERIQTVIDVRLNLVPRVRKLIKSIISRLSTRLELNRNNYSDEHIVACFGLTVDCELLNAERDKAGNVLSAPCTKAPGCGSFFVGSKPLNKSDRLLRNRMTNPHNTFLKSVVGSKARDEKRKEERRNKKIEKSWRVLGRNPILGTLLNSCEIEKERDNTISSLIRLFFLLQRQLSKKCSFRTSKDISQSLRRKEK